jgi:uncharacterized cupin superfamily protein
MAEPKHLIRAQEVAEKSQRFSHPWNPKSELLGFQLGKAAGLSRTGVNIARMPPGKESFVYHAHEYEEEWIYILDGKGIAIIDGRPIEVSAGDFMAFPTPSVAHHLKNPFDRDLVYLMGGETRDFEVADFPELGRRMLRHAGKIEIYDIATGKPFP